MNNIEPFVIDNFMFRFPAFTFQKINEIYAFEKLGMSKRDIIISLLKDEKFRTAIRTASPGLYSSLDNISNKKNKEIKNIYYSLIKYHIRMFSRPTPFSTFSSVGMGAFEDKEEPIRLLNILENNNKVKVRISHEWLYKYIANIEDDTKVFRLLTLKTNKLIHELTEKYYLGYFSDFGNETNSSLEEVSLKQTPLLKFILSSFIEETNVSEVVNDIVNNNDNVTEEQVLKYIQNLTKKDFLISNLRISSSIEEPHLFIRDILENMGYNSKKYCEQLDILERKLSKSYNLNIDDLDEIENYMKSITKAPEYIHIDRYYDENKSLPKSIQDDISEYARVFMQVSNLINQGNEHLDFYFSKFVDTYGLFNAVPIKILLEDKTELGPPPTYTNPVSLLDYEYSKFQKNEFGVNTSFFKKILYKSFVERAHSIDISKELNDNSASLSDFSQGSFDLYLSIYAKSREELKNGNYSIYPTGNIASSFAGRTMGRFLDMFPEHKKAVQVTIDSEEKLIGEESLLANLNIIPVKGRSSNVMNSSNQYEYDISISSNNNPNKIPIDLDDLYIYVDGEKFNIMSKSNNKLITPLTSHMLNHQFWMPNFYRFLLDVTFYSRTPIVPFNWGEFEDLPYLPEVKCNNYIIKQRSWNIQIKDDINNNKMHDYIEEFFEKYNVPRYIKCIEFDNYIFIDTQSSIMMDLFKHELINKKKINFIDANEFSEDSLLKSDEGDYINEIVVSAFNIIETEKKGNGNFLNFYSQKDRIKHLGSDWIYLKIYHPINYDFEILTQHISKFFTENENDLMYFIRYTDPYPHIRLRVKVSNKLYEMLEKVNFFSSLLHKNKLVSKTVYDDYNREIERYGGNSLIDRSEEIFWIDSKMILKLLPLTKIKSFRIEDFALSSLGDILSFFIKDIPLYKWLEENVLVDKKFYKDYRKYYKNRIKDYNQSYTISKETINEELKLLEENIQSYSNEFINNNYNDNYFNYIILSILHMHLNRFGIHSEVENMIMNFLYFQKKEEYMRMKNNKKTNKDKVEVF